MNTIEIMIKGNGTLTVEQGTTYSKLIDIQNNDEIVGIRVNDELTFPAQKIKNKDRIEFITRDTSTGEKIYQSGVKFLVEVALKETHPQHIISYNHSISNGIHAEITGPTTFTQEDFQKLLDVSKKIIDNKEEITKVNVEKEEAINYFNYIRDYEKANNIHNITNNVLTLNRLRNTINYYYNFVPTNTKYLKDLDLHFLKENEIIVLLPLKHKVSENPSYVHYEKIINNYKDNRNWLNKLDIKYLSDINKKISEYKVLDLIKVSETFFNIKIINAASEIIEHQAKYVLIAGPSSSGKTTSTKKLALALESQGYKPFIISVDDYFVDSELTPKNDKGLPDYECLEALDTKLLSENLKQLIEGEEVTLPTFNFIKGKKEFTRKVKLPQNSIILMEGLHCLNDRLTDGIPQQLKYKIYLSPFISLKIDKHNYISSTDLRILRRIIRDKRTRNKSVEQTISYLETLKHGEENYIYPFIDQANMIINTSLPYEINLLKVYVEPLLYSIDNNSPYYEESRRLISFLKTFFPITSEYVNKDSILREFIGGSIFE